MKIRRVDQMDHTLPPSQQSRARSVFESSSSKNEEEPQSAGVSRVKKRKIGLSITHDAVNPPLFRIIEERWRTSIEQAFSAVWPVGAGRAEKFRKVRRNGRGERLTRVVHPRLRERPFRPPGPRAEDLRPLPFESLREGPDFGRREVRGASEAPSEGGSLFPPGMRNSRIRRGISTRATSTSTLSPRRYCRPVRRPTRECVP